MNTIDQCRRKLIVVLVVIGLVTLFSSKGSLASYAQVEPSFIKHVRDFDPDNVGALNPAGLTYSPNTRQFLVLEAVQPATAPPATSIFIGVTPVEKRVGSQGIAMSISNPLNMVFDGVHNRLLFLRSARSNLFAVSLDANGNLDPTTLKPYNIHQFDLRNPQGMAIDPADGRLFILDQDGPRLLIITPDASGGFDNAQGFEIDLSQTGIEDPRGLAFHPTSQHLHLIDTANQLLYELKQDGSIFTTRDLSDFDIDYSQGLVFAPSGDLTDDPMELSLYLADSALSNASSSMQRDRTVQRRPGKIVELSFTEVKAAAAATIQSDLVQTIRTSEWSPPSPDPAGVVYLPKSDRLLVSDSEVNEMPIYAGANQYIATLTGDLRSTFTTLDFSNEPTGVAYDFRNDHLYYSDDTGIRSVYELNPGYDSQYGTLDDSVTTFSTETFSSFDPEGITFAVVPGNFPDGVLFIVDGVNMEVYRVAPGPNQIFDGVPPQGDDTFDSFDTEHLALRDPEGIAYDSNKGTLYAVGEPADTLFELTVAGNLVQTIDISAANARMPAGLAFAPSSVNPSVMSIYVVDRGVDNDSDPDENDGKVYELTLPDIGLVPPVANDDDATTIENIPVSIDVSANDSDANGNLNPASANSACVYGSVGCLGASHGLLADAGDGSITYTPNQGFVGADAFVYEICDSDALCSTAVVNITVNANSPPVANGESFTIVEDMLFTFDVAANDTDVDGNLDPSSVNTTCNTCSDVANGALVNHADGTFDYTPDPGFVGLDGFRYQICDTLSYCDTADVTITVLEIPTFDTIHLGTTDGGSVAGIYFADEDILTYDMTTDAWSLRFDGSDVGLTTSGQEIDGLYVNQDGTMLLSLGISDTIPNIGNVDDFDILRFIPTSLGDNTSGTYEMYFDGEDVGLVGEDIDAIGFTPDGRLVVSLRDSFDLGEVSGTDEDLLAFTATSLGPVTSGSWELLFDGSDVALDTTDSEDVNGVWVDAIGRIHLTVRGDYSTDGLAGDGADIFTCLPTSTGSNTSCSFSLFWDGSMYGLAGEVISDFAFQLQTGTENQPPTVYAGDDQTITLPDSATLSGTASDDGLPMPSSLTTTWSKVSGPGSVTFADASVLNTTASFSMDGTYVLRLTADDGELSAFDEVTVYVNPASSENQPPVVNAGTDQTITLTNDVTLNGTASDDGLPAPPSLATNWSTVSGPGVVAFANPGALSTTASFSLEGSYVLRLTADDGELSSFDEVTITVNPATSATIEVRVAVDSDDAEEVPGGRLYLTSTDLELVTDRTDIQQVGIRFNGVNIPQGATITAAYVQFKVDEPTSEGTNLVIAGEDADNPETFSPTSNVSSRSRTAAQVAWEPVSWLTKGVAGADQRTPDLKTVIQEIVGRPGWSSGNSLVLIITGTGRRVAESYKGDAAGAPLLHVEYSGGPPNSAPVAADDSASTDEDVAVRIDVAANDSDADGNLDLATTNTGCSACSEPSLGTVTSNGDGSFNYVPAAEVNGSDSFVYEICDTRGACDTATVSVTVRAVPDAPQATDDVVSTQKDIPLTIDVAANDSDPDGDLNPTTANTGCTGCALPGNGGLINNGDGTFEYSPNTGFIGLDGFQYEICDTGGLCDQAVVSITVSSAAPVTIEVRVSASTDDAEERATGGMYISSSDLEMVSDKDDQTVGLHFTGLAIPQGATIVNAYVQFRTDEVNTETTELVIEGQEIDDAPAFSTTKYDISSRPRTSASVPWSPAPWATKGEAGADQQTPDIAALIQEIVGRPGWTSGNALVLIISGSGKRVAESYNGDAAGAPLLHIEYFGGG